MTKEEYKSIAQACRGIIKKTKVQLDLQLARDGKVTRRISTGMLATRRSSGKMCGTLTEWGRQPSNR